MACDEGWGYGFTMAVVGWRNSLYILRGGRDDVRFCCDDTQDCYVILCQL